MNVWHYGYEPLELDQSGVAVLVTTPEGKVTPRPALLLTPG